MNSQDPLTPPLVLIFARSSSYLQFFHTTLDSQYDIVEASLAFSCLEMLSNLKIDLLILDEKLIGDEIESFLKQVKAMQEYRNLPIFMISRNLKKSHARALQEMGIIAMIREPLDQENVLTVLKEHCPKKVLDTKVANLASRIARPEQTPELNFKHRFLLNDKASAQIRSILKEKQSLSLAMLELDNYSEMLEQYPDINSVEILDQVDSKITSMLREQDVMVPLGGGKYMIILPKTSKNAALSMAEEIQSSIELLSITTKHGMLHLSISIGVACKNIEEEQDTSAAMRQLSRLVNLASSLAIESKHSGGEVTSEV